MPLLLVPDQTPFTRQNPEDRKHATWYAWITGLWLALMRDIVHALNRINNGIAYGIVVTDEEGKAVAVQGEWVDVAHVAGNFTADSGTWTVDIADQVTWKWFQLGKLLWLQFSIEGSSLSGGQLELRITLPNLYVADFACSTVIDLEDNAVVAVGTASVAAAGTYLSIKRQDLAAFAASVDATDVRGQIVIGIV